MPQIRRIPSPKQVFNHSALPSLPINRAELTLAAVTVACEAIDRERRTAARASAVRERLFSVLTWINEKKDHIPPFKKGTAVCYPYDISCTSDPSGSGDNSDSNWAMNMLKRVVQAGPPMLMKNQ